MGLLSLLLHIYAACFGLLLGHPQALRYKNHKKEDTIKKGPNNCKIRTNKMHVFLLNYFSNYPLNVSNR